jgi:2-polyprenyl-3-methyl-5-hydroxy-6-metoxy-1,4-benzoquinol methylase
MSLDERRTAAALASEGRSDDVIHRAVLAQLRGENAEGAVLDVGAGRGDLLVRLQRLGRFSHLAGADLVAFSGPLPDIEWITCDLNEPLPVPDESYDTLLAVEVIEHLENPWGAARDWFRVLRPGGLAIVTTPNNESLRSLLTLAVRGHFAAFGDDNFPAHLTALVRSDLRRIVSEAGFGFVRFFPIGHGVVPRVTHLTWQRLSAGRLTGIRFSDNVGCVVRRPA